MRVSKVLHCIWLSNTDHEFRLENTPEIVQKCIGSFLRVHGIDRPAVVQNNFEMPKTASANWALMLWTDASCTPENFPYTFHRIVQCVTMAQKSDLMRYEILARHGGWYVDADMFFFKSLDLLYEKENECSEGDQLFVCHENDGDERQRLMMSTSVIGCTPHHPVLIEASSTVSQQPINTEQVNETTGPFFFGSCIRDAAVTRYVSKTFYPMLWNFSAETIIKAVEFDSENQFQSTIAAHCWLGSWKKHSHASRN